MHDTESSTHTSTSGLDFSSPYLRYSLCLDFFRYIRIKSQITYQHITMSQSDAEVDENLNISTHKLVLRYGGELLHPSKTRKKSSHLWGGLYYEMTWDWVYSSIGTEKTSTGKWVLCFGT